jgi:2'-5' RNA ligase
VLEHWQALDAVAGGHHVFVLPVSGLCAAPSPRRCRMIWAEFDDADGACARLAADIAAACSPFCDVDTERAFRAHATLCRARRPHHIDPDVLQAASDCLAATAQPMSVPCFTLFASRLTPRGPIYSAVRSMRLNGA